MNPILTIAVQCHNFQRRLCWMLSSIKQQTQPGIVSVVVDCETSNGNPTTEAVAKFFNAHGVNVAIHAWPPGSEFRFRGIVRNRQLNACTTEWMMFGDADMVYHPSYFERLVAHLENHHSAYNGLLSSGRMSNDKTKCSKLVNDSISGRDPVLIQGAFGQASALDLHRRSNVGAGFSQILNMSHAPHGLEYVDPKSNRDWDWNKAGSNPRSDIQFRKKIHALGATRINLPDEFTTGAIHLNHNRDPETRTHLVEQR